MLFIFYVTFYVIFYVIFICYFSFLFHLKFTSQMITYKTMKLSRLRECRPAVAIVAHGISQGFAAITFYSVSRRHTTSAEERFMKVSHNSVSTPNPTSPHVPNTQDKDLPLGNARKNFSR